MRKPEIKKIDALTPQNEPATIKMENAGHLMARELESSFVMKNLGPLLERTALKTKI